tara:strand:- start:1019 stop:2287 length:1269 start_codon:yes stop_codon:yes gene_type:complete
MFNLLKKLWPLHRTINCEEIDEAFNICKEYLNDNKNYNLHKFKPGTDVMTWKIPYRYKVNKAILKINGKVIADFDKNPLHLLSYSVPKKSKGKLKDIRKHIYFSKKLPNSIPWEFKYYEKNWGFCVKYKDYKKYKDTDNYDLEIDVEFQNKAMTVADYFIPGKSKDEILFMTNICHPMQVNDSLTGLVVALELAKKIRKIKNRRLGLRILIVPETIGTVAWFSKLKKNQINRIKYAWFCEMVGHNNSFILQHSRQGSEALIDKAFLVTLNKYKKHGIYRTGAFREVVASDEMVSNGPGFDIPTPSLTRWPYKEYHTSFDSPKIIDKSNLNETLDFFNDLYEVIDKNYYPKRNFTGPIMLSRYNLWIDWRDDWDLNISLDKLMLMLEGDKSIIDISYELNLNFYTVYKFIDKLYSNKLITKSF